MFEDFVDERGEGQEYNNPKEKALAGFKDARQKALDGLEDAGEKALNDGDALS